MPLLDHSFFWCIAFQVETESKQESTRIMLIPGAFYVIVVAFCMLRLVFRLYEGAVAEDIRDVGLGVDDRLNDRRASCQ